MGPRQAQNAAKKLNDALAPLYTARVITVHDAEGGHIVELNPKYPSPMHQRKDTDDMHVVDVWLQK
jgi:hypothetical protein